MSLDSPRNRHLHTQQNYPSQPDSPHAAVEHEGEESFGELLRFTVPGYVLGLLLAYFFDARGWQRSAVGQWLVRTLSGEGESIFEGLFYLLQRLRKASASMAEAYARGKFLGMTAPWLVDWGSRLAGVNVYGVEGFYIPYFYALSDQIGANVSGALYLRQKNGDWRQALAIYFHDPTMLTSLMVILLVPLGLLLARILGFQPNTQIYTSLETIAANLCWVPPLAGWLSEKRKAKSDR